MTEQNLRTSKIVTKFHDFKTTDDAATTWFIHYNLHLPGFVGVSMLIAARVAAMAWSKADVPLPVLFCGGGVPTVGDVDTITGGKTVEGPVPGGGRIGGTVPGGATVTAGGSTGATVPGGTTPPGGIAIPGLSWWTGAMTTGGIAVAIIPEGGLMAAILLN